MRVQTFSIVAGTTACNACCPYCISKMTPRQGVLQRIPEINWRNFVKACQLAKTSAVTTILITGKGEPTLYPKQITGFLQKLEKFEFPLIELQTNGIVFGKNWPAYKNHLKKWHALGLSTISLSIVHYSAEKNQQIFTPGSKYFDLAEVIKKLHKIGFSVRLSCTLINGFINSAEKVSELIKFSKSLEVEQLSIRKLSRPLNPEVIEVFEWTKKHELPKAKLDEIISFLDAKGHRLMTLPHGGVIFDIDGQNICITDALTIRPDTDNLRQIIFFPDGHLRFDWQFKGAVLL